MDKEIKMRSDLRHTQRDKLGVVVTMFIVSSCLAGMSSLTLPTSKPVSYSLAGSSLAVLGVCAVKIFRLERKENDIARRLKQLIDEKQNG